MTDGPKAKVSHGRPQASPFLLSVMVTEVGGAAGGRLSIFQAGISTLVPGGLVMASILPSCGGCTCPGYGRCWCPAPEEGRLGASVPGEPGTRAVASGTAALLCLTRDSYCRFQMLPLPFEVRGSKP